jgi:activator of HSP90 ATPase
MVQPVTQPITFGRITRRNIVSGLALALGGVAVGLDSWAASQQQAMKQTPATTANQSRASLHQEIDLKATPQRIYEILLDSRQFAAFTGMPAEIDPKAGGTFSMFGGQIGGRNVELVPAARIVQAWRPTHWDPGVYSIVRFELKPQESGVKVILDHTGFPEGDYDHLFEGWNSHYWQPLTKYLS